MKAILEFVLPEEQEELDAAVKAMEWKRCLEEVCQTVVAWRWEKSDPPFLGREQEGTEAMEHVLTLIHEKMEQKGLRFD